MYICAPVDPISNSRIATQVLLLNDLYSQALHCFNTIRKTSLWSLRMIQAIKTKN